MVFTDMDGCLLDHNTYEWEPARPAIETLKRLHVPLVLTTSKTRAEVEYWQRLIGLHEPAIIENGGALLIPTGSLPTVPPEAEFAAGTQTAVWRLGWPHHQVVKALHRAAAESRCDIRGFSDMTVEEVASHCDMTVEQASLACRREYSEPFLLLSPKREPALLQAFLAHGLKVTRGGRFHHAQRHPGKGEAVGRLLDFLAAQGTHVTSIGLGDGLNDEGFLRVVDYPIILDSAHADELHRLIPHARRTPLPGPAAWAAALLDALKELRDHEGPAA
ncbi:MAG: HAD-IIB family hydrolase [Bryobacteraceae bacterium]|nr:HAD-IIB family hydrolase [Bryobacteraceae bacterium]